LQERIAPKSIKIDMEKRSTKFSALNVDFNGSSVHEGIKEQYPRKSRYFVVVGQSFVKTVGDRHGHAAYHNKHY